VPPEYDPAAAPTFLTPVACAMVDREFDIEIDPSSRAFACYRSARSRETYRCSFEIDPARQDALHAAGLRIAGVDDAGHARIVELADHPFYIGTLFVPQMNLTSTPHPLIAGLIAAARSQARSAALAVSASSPEPSAVTRAGPSSGD
jgi:CTP synthase (UTP-ammonia lyase)